MISLKKILSVVTLCIASISLCAAEEAGQYQQSGRYQVHYMALNTTFLTPEISKEYSIKRSRYNAFVNVSILDTLLEGNPSIQGKITGSAVNLIGNTKILEFQEIIEGQAIYYIAELPFRNEERFTISIQAVNKDGLNTQISFKQKLYAD